MLSHLLVVRLQVVGELCFKYKVPQVDLAVTTALFNCELALFL